MTLMRGRVKNFYRCVLLILCLPYWLNPGSSFKMLLGEFEQKLCNLSGDFRTSAVDFQSRQLCQSLSPKTEENYRPQRIVLEFVGPEPALIQRSISKFLSELATAPLQAAGHSSSPLPLGNLQAKEKVNPEKQKHTNSLA